MFMLLLLFSGNKTDIRLFVILVRVYATVQFGYMLFIFKSLLYAVLVSILVWMCKVQNHIQSQTQCCLYTKLFKDSTYKYTVHII